MIIANQDGCHPVDALTVEVAYLARLAGVLLREHVDDAGCCVTCVGQPFPCGAAVLAERTTALH